VDAEEVYFTNLLDMIGRPFRHEAENRKLQFDIAISTDLERSIITDSKRLPAGSERICCRMPSSSPPRAA